MLPAAPFASSAITSQQDQQKNHQLQLCRNAAPPADQRHLWRGEARHSLRRGLFEIARGEKNRAFCVDPHPSILPDTSRLVVHAACSIGASIGWLHQFGTMQGEIAATVACSLACVALFVSRNFLCAGACARRIAQICLRMRVC